MGEIQFGNLYQTFAIEIGFGDYLTNENRIISDIREVVKNLIK